MSVFGVPHLDTDWKALARRLDWPVLGTNLRNRTDGIGGGLTLGEQYAIRRLYAADDRRPTEGRT